MTLYVHFEPIGRRIQANEHKTILEAARMVIISDVDTVKAPCGGKGLCGQCKIRIIHGTISPPTDREQEVLSSEELADGYRLACQARALTSLDVEIPPESLSGRQELQLDGPDFAVAVDPIVRRYSIEVTPSTLAHPLSALQQAVLELEKRHGMEGLTVDIDAVRDQPALVTEPHVLTVTVNDHRIVNAFHSYPPPKPLGLAVDLGTTKIAGFLVDLESGVTVASKAITNPQIPYGEDVVSRLTYCMEREENRDRLALLVRDCIDQLLLKLVSRIGAHVHHVEHAVIVGNTAMHHLFLKLPVEQLGKSPYCPSAACAMEGKARDMGIHMAPGADVYFVPLIAGFVGSDHVAMILGSRIFQRDAVTLGIDVGTNTEIVLATRNELMSCSCASGPAFEGGHVQHGMRAVDGAISEVTLNNAGSVSYKTIGSAPPLGLCGSGVVDAVAELVRTGIVNRIGVMDRNHPNVRVPAQGNNVEYVIAEAAESGTGHAITVTQKDVVAIQLAKAAIRTGTELLLSANGITPDAVERVVFAGAFGTRVNLKSALAIGLAPALPRDRFRHVGNAAGTGARLALLSRSERKLAETIAQQTRYMELTAVPEFADTFAHALQFPDTAE